MATNITPKIKSVIARDKKVMLTTTRVSYPFVAERGSGDIVFDVSGNKFIDFSSFIAVYNLGINANEQIRTAIKKQTDKLMHAAFTDYYSESPVTFAEDLLKMFPKGFGKIFFSNSGTEANEAAIKFTRMFTKRQYNIAFYGGFHGRTLGSLSLTASRNTHRKDFGPFNSTIHVPYAYCYRCPWGKEYPSCGIACADYIKKYPLSKEVAPDEVGAIFMEPIQGEGGYIVPPKEFVKEVRNIASDNGMLLVADEIQSGYMRTGKFLALDHFGVQADIYTMAKGLGGGMPLGATITRSSLGDIVHGSHGNTFGANLVSIAAADASLKYLNANKAKLESEIKRKSAIIFKRLNKMKDQYEIIGDVRGIGLMIAIELVKNKESKEPAIEEREKLLQNAFSNGLLLLPAGISTVRIIPPVIISDENLTKGLDILEESVRNANKLLKIK